MDIEKSDSDIMLIKKRKRVEEKFVIQCELY